MVAEAAAGYRPRRSARQHLIRGRRGQIGLTSWGPPSDDPIVMLHGWMDCGAAMQLLVDQLPDEWSLTAVDWPGCGRSDGYDGGYWFAECLADLEWVLDQLLPDQPARVIGHSLGGAVALMLAGVRPQRLRWLVDMEGFGLPHLAPSQVPERIAGWLDALRDIGSQKSYPSLAALASTLCARNPHMPPAHASYLARTWTRDAAGGGVQLLADELHRLPSPIRYSREDMEACWARVRHPVLMMYGSDSRQMQRIGGDVARRRWQQLVPTMQFAAVDNADHLLPYEQPCQTAAHIVRFVQSLG